MNTEQTVPEPTHPGFEPAAPGDHGTHVVLPQPSVWPMFLALGITLLVAAIPLGWIVGAVGAFLFVLALGGWIQDMRREMHHRDH